MRKSFLRLRQLTCGQKLNPVRKQNSPLRVKNDVTHAIQLKLHERMNKSRFQAIVTSYGRNKNLDDELKKPREGQTQPQLSLCRYLNDAFWQNIGLN